MVVGADLELVRILQEEFTPLEIDEESFAFDAHLEVGHGGHFFGATHSLERFRTGFSRPLVSSTENFARWSRNGGKDAVARATELVRRAEEEYEEPSIDPAVEESLRELVRVRRAELGD